MDVERTGRSESDATERELRIESMRLDIKLAEQGIRLAPWKRAIVLTTVLALVLWCLVIVAWAVGPGENPAG